jgi:hypothetical protein
LEELLTLVDMTVSGSPKLPAGHPFLGSLAGNFWTATSFDRDPSVARVVSLFDGDTGADFKDAATNGYWCVRGGRGFNGS